MAASGGRPTSKGFFVEPTIFVGANNGDCAGGDLRPVGTVIPLDDSEEAVRLTNATRYRLTATIWTRDVAAAHTLAAKVRAGAV